MKITHYPALNYVRANQAGSASIEGQAGFLNAIFTSHFWKPGTPLVIDFGSLEMEGVDDRMLDSARTMLMILEKEIAGGRLALLCETDKQFDAGEVFKSKVANHLNVDLRVFRDEADAIAWATEPTAKNRTTVVID